MDRAADPPASNNCSAENMAFIIDLVIYARNIFVAIPAQPGRLYEVVLCQGVGWIRKQTQQKLGCLIEKIRGDDVPANGWRTPVLVLTESGL